MLNVSNNYNPLKTGLGGIFLTGTSSFSMFLVQVAPIISAIGIILGAVLTLLSLIVYIRNHFKRINHFPFVAFRKQFKE